MKKKLVIKFKPNITTAIFNFLFAVILMFVVITTLITSKDLIMNIVLIVLGIIAIGWLIKIGIENLTGEKRKHRLDMIETYYEE